MSATALLDGVHVLDLTRIIAGPYATRTLAEFGADVIKVEDPNGGDSMRTDIPWGRNVRFMGFNYGKRSIAVDLKRPAGLAIVREIADRSDVFIENFRPGTADRLGLSYAELARTNPRLIYCSISGWGQDGPDRPMHAAMAHAVSGIMGMIDGDPRPLPASIGDPITSVHAVAAICAALYHREKCGRGQRIDLSLVDVVYAMMGPQAEHQTYDGGTQPLPQTGDRSPNTVPTGLFRARDGWLMLGGGVEDLQWQRLANVIGRPDLADRRHRWRRANATEIYGAIDSWLLSMESADAAEQALAEASVVVGKVRSPEQARRDPVLRKRGVILALDGPAGEYEGTTLPYRFSATPQRLAGHAPGLGEHTREVLDQLGYAVSAIDALYADGTVATEQRPNEYT